jgi:S1-C subfamily serine protease
LDNLDLSATRVAAPPRWINECGVALPKVSTTRRLAILDVLLADDNVLHTAGELRRGEPWDSSAALVEINDLTKEDADKLGLPLGRGVRVVRVVDGGPAEVAGLLPDDILLSLDGSDIADAKETIAAIQTREPGSQVLLRISRAGTERTMVAVL